MTVFHFLIPQYKRMHSRTAQAKGLPLRQIRRQELPICGYLAVLHLRARLQQPVGLQLYHPHHDPFLGWQRWRC
ncbi:MAG: hypothetical protein D8H96_10670 [Lautropia sp.]|nr:MAG: hypothetical protein D8H96_10670 [Lautropia sp.]